ncbi:hypothetical protein ABZT34_40255 [Streptomyces sp. NPDC005329]|uniref:hypothetical protein n=1 Tax=Streptomyces sp. NPDC005329 TaxID=3157034 RepID=UPI0033BD9798
MAVSSAAFSGAQDAILGPHSAFRSYRTARGMFTELDIPHQVARTELLLPVVQEMFGQLEGYARRYELLARGECLSPRGRADAQLWMGAT